MASRYTVSICSIWYLMVIQEMVHISTLLEELVTTCCFGLRLYSGRSLHTIYELTSCCLIAYLPR